MPPVQRHENDANNRQWDTNRREIKHAEAGKIVVAQHPLTTMFEVVKSVAMPPRIVAKAKGMGRREELTRTLWEIPGMVGKSTAAAAILFITSESTAPAAITVTIKERSRVPPTRSSASPARSVSLVTRSASTRTKIETIVTTAELAKPENASRGVNTPVMPRATATGSATRFGRRRSESMRIAAAARINSVMRIVGVTVGLYTRTGWPGKITIYPKARGTVRV